MSAFPAQVASYSVAAIQYAPTAGAKAQNIAELHALVETAARNGARLIVLPELATTGSCWLTREEIAPSVETVPGPTSNHFQQLAADYQCFIALSLPEVDATTQIYYHTIALIGPAGLVGKYRKLHTSLGEARWARDGDLGIVVWQTPLGQLTVMTDTDTLYFETARCATLQGADVLLLSAGWSDEHCTQAWWAARAFENGISVIVANRSGNEQTRHFCGGSCIINPDGSRQQTCQEPVGIIYGTITPAASHEKQWRHEQWVLGSPVADRRPDEYLSLTQNTYLWEPFRFHGLYGQSELPPGQLSCVGFIQMPIPEQPTASNHETISALQAFLKEEMFMNAPASPDVLVLPELLLPGIYLHATTAPEQLAAYFQQGAITVPGPETDALVALAKQLQISMVLGVAERSGTAFYNTILLIDPMGIYGSYRKLHLDARDRLWATPGDQGLPVFDTPTGRIGLATGYDTLFPETIRILASKGADIVCAPACLALPDAMCSVPAREDTVQDNPTDCLIGRVRAAEHNVYLALANWYGYGETFRARGLSGIYPPSSSAFPGTEVVADDNETGLMMMTIDTREQRTGRRTSRVLDYSPGDMAGSLTGELDYNIFDSIPGNVVRSKPWLRKRLPFWYLDLIRTISK